MLFLSFLYLFIAPAGCSDPEVEVVIPHLIWSGQTPDEPIFTHNRKPRSLPGDTASHPDNMYIHLLAFGRDLHLHLQRVHDFLAAGFVVEERTKLGDKIQTKIPKEELCFYVGEVLNYNKSFASVSTCSGLTGFIHIGEEQLMIQPSNATLQPGTHFSGREHIIRHKRQAELSSSSLQSETPQRKCQVISGKKKKQNKNGESGDYRERRNAIRLGDGHTVETLVVADADMVQYHGPEATQRFILTVMNMVYNMFQHQSLGIKVNIRVSKLVLLHSRPVKLSIGHHGERSLESFCHWQNEEYGGSKYLGNNYVPGAKDEVPVDVAVFMTRTDFCVHKDEPCDTVGHCKRFLKRHFKDQNTFDGQSMKAR